MILPLNLLKTLKIETSQEAEEIDKRILKLVDKYKIPITRVSSLTAVQEVLNLL